MRVGGEGSLRDLLDLAAPIAMQAFDRDRPLWEFHVADGLAGDRAGVVMKLHHVVSDGMGLVRMTRQLVERSREPVELPPREPEPAQSAPRSGFEHLQDAVQHRAGTAADRAGRMLRAAGRGLGDFARDPVGATRQLGETAGSIGRLLRPASEPLSPVMTARSMTVRFDVLTVSMESLKAASGVVQGTLNDAFVASVAGALRLYHEHQGKPTEALRMNMPINLREGDKGRAAGNQFVPARFAVPIAIADPAERMRAIHELVQTQRGELALPLLDEITGAINRLGVGPATRVAGSMMKAVDFVTSNVPGPRFPVYAAGAKIDNMYPFGPLAGAAVNITLFSYDGQLQIGVNTDAAAVADPELFVACLEKGISEVQSVA